MAASSCARTARSSRQYAAAGRARVPRDERYRFFSAGRSGARHLRDFARAAGVHLECLRDSRLGSMYFLLAGAVERFHLLKCGPALILIFRGPQDGVPGSAGCSTEVPHLPGRWASLALLVSMVGSLLWTPKSRFARPRRAAQPLRQTADDAERCRGRFGSPNASTPSPQRQTTQRRNGSNGPDRRSSFWRLPPRSPDDVRGRATLSNERVSAHEGPAQADARARFEGVPERLPTAQSGTGRPTN